MANLDSSFSLDNPPSPSETDDTDSQEALNIVIKFISKVCDKSSEELKTKIIELGIKTISDIAYLDLPSSFNGFLKAVEIGRLKSEYELFSKNTTGQPEKEPMLMDFKSMFTSAQLEKLSGNLSLERSDWLMVTKIAGDYLYYTMKGANSAACLKTAETLITKFNGAFKLKGLSQKESVAALSKQLYDRIKYRLRLKRKSSSEQLDDPETSKLIKFSKRHSFALDVNRDLPVDYPEGENKESQEAKRQEMITMHRSGEISWQRVLKLMEDTYVSQRLSIHTHKHMANILNDWPFIGKFTLLKNHFFKLMNKDPTTVFKHMETLTPKLLQFLKFDASKKRRGEAAKPYESIKRILGHYNKMQEKTADVEFCTLIMCLALKLKQELKHLFIFFDETTSFDEVQASRQLPKAGNPIVAVLGNNLVDVPKCFVLVDNTIISPQTVPPLKAVVAVFMSYFVFKIVYPTEINHLLEFIQRAYFEITGEGEDGQQPTSSRAARRKTAGGWCSNPPIVSPRYTSFMAAFSEFQSQFDL